MDYFLTRLPDPTKEGVAHNYYFKDSTLIINGMDIGTVSKIDTTILQNILQMDIIKSLEFYNTAVFLFKNHITAQIKCFDCGYRLYYYRPTLENDRGDSRYIILNNSKDIDKLIKNNNDTILDRKLKLLLIANLDNPIYSTE